MNVKQFFLYNVKKHWFNFVFCTSLENETNFSKSKLSISKIIAVLTSLKRENKWNMLESYKTDLEII